MPNKYVKKKNAPSKTNIEEAIKAINENNVSISQAARSFKLSKTTLLRHLGANKAGTSLPPPGGHRSLPEDTEIEISAKMKTLSRWGFGLTREEFKDILQIYIKEHRSDETEEGEHLRKYCKLTDDRPGDVWVKDFLMRYNMSSKIPSNLEKARKIASKDPEIIYGFYTLLYQTMSSLQILDKPQHVWNVDETCLFTDPSKTRIIAPVGEKATRTTYGTGREAFTVMAGISAGGEKLPPLILFKGKNLQSTWKADKAYPGTQYAVSPNGWMVTDVFNSWFCHFCEIIKQRPLLLIFDGHVSHISLELIEKARAEKVTILKLPPHTTDRLQPLDVCCFRPLKVQWDKRMVSHLRHGSGKVDKASFVVVVLPRPSLEGARPRGRDARGHDHLFLSQQGERGGGL